MGTSLSHPGVPGFWDRFIVIAASLELARKQIRWHVRHTEHYLRAYPDKLVTEHQATDVSAHLSELGRRTGLEPWQFVQSVDAIRILFETVNDLDWPGRFDWDYWKGSARSLKPSHATIAHEVGGPARPWRGDSSSDHAEPPACLFDQDRTGL